MSDLLIQQDPRLEAKRRLAMAMMQQGQTPIQSGSWLEGLMRGLQQGFGTYQMAKAARQEKDQQDQFNNTLATATGMASNPNLVSDTGGVMLDKRDFSDPIFDQTKMGALPSASPDQRRSAMVSALMADPTTRPMAGKMALTAALQPPAKPDIVQEGAVALDPITHKPIFSNAKPAPKVETPADMQVALWVNGGDENAARAWLKGVKTPKPEKGPEAPQGYRFQADGSLTYIPGGPADPVNKARDAQPPSGYRYSADGKNLEAIPGGPADIGQKGLPQSYKEAKASIETFGKTLDAFEKQFGKSGTELFNTGAAGDLDSKYASILFGIKNMEQTGALDKGSVDVIEGMLKRPTGFSATFTANNYFKKQIAAAREYMKNKETALDKAFASGAPAAQPPGAAAQPAPQAQASVDSIPPPAQRKKGAVYPTPQGNMTWTGTGWIPFSEPVL